MTPWLYTPIIPIDTPIVAGGDTMSSITEKPEQAAPTLYCYSGEATGKDPTGYYYPRWDLAQKVSVIAASRAEATWKLMRQLGDHPRFGDALHYGWTVRWDKIEEVPPEPKPAGFENGYEAGYAARAAEEPSDEQVEAAAWALYGEDTSWGFVVVYSYGEQALAWGELDDEDQEMFRGFARRALRAARDTREQS